MYMLLFLTRHHPVLTLVNMYNTKLRNHYNYSHNQISRFCFNYSKIYHILSFKSISVAEITITIENI